MAKRIKAVFPWWATTPSRLVFSGVISVPVFLTYSLKASLTFYVLLFLGLLFRWSPWQYMATPRRDILCLTARGLLLTAPAGFLCGLYLFGLSGSLMGLSYWLGYNLPLSYTEPDGYTWIGSDWGELIFGAVLGLAMGFNI